jgi:lipopolysaccharide transport system permease protein
MRMENRSPQPWRAADGFAVGSQILDPGSGTYIEDGARTALPTGLEPGAASPLEVRVDLPLVDGRYHVVISLIENDRWCYKRGWPFVLVDAVVEGGKASLASIRTTTLRRLRAASLLRSLGKALRYPLQSLWRHRSLVRSMVWRDILGRYRGSMGGLFWTLLNPLLLMLTYYFVFGVVLRTRFAGDPSRSGFVLYFLAGMLPWLPFSEAAGRAPSVLLEYRNFVKRLVFPLETLPVTLTAAGLVTELVALAILAALAAMLRGAVPASLLWLPVLLAPQILFTLGVCWFLAASGVYLRDLSQVNGFLLTLWFFLTPICYPEQSLPPAAMAVLSKNPLFVLVRGYRAILLEGHAPEFAPLWKLWIVSALVFVAGYAWFYRLRRTFADVI